MNGKSRPEGGSQTPAKASTSSLAVTDEEAAQLALDFSGRDAAEANADGWWWSTAMAGVTALAKSDRVFEAFDVAELGVPDPDSPARWGALMASAAKAGLIRPVGAKPSRRPTVCGSLTRTWRGAR